MKKPQGAVQAQKLVVGEIVEFTDYVITQANTKYGVSPIIGFADNDGVIKRKAYVQGGMLEFLNQNKDTDSIVLKKKLVDGEFTYNVWARD